MGYVKSILKSRHQDGNKVTERTTSDETICTMDFHSNPSDSARSLCVDVATPSIDAPCGNEAPLNPHVELTKSPEVKRHILFGKVTTQEFDKKKPASCVSRLFRSQKPQSQPNSPSRWELSNCTGIRGSLMPFIPRRRSSDSNEEGHKVDAHDVFRMIDAAALIEDPSCELRVYSPQILSNHPPPSPGRESPRLHRRRGSSCVDTEGGLQDDGNHSPRKPTRRGSVDIECVKVLVDKALLEGDAERGSRTDDSDSTEGMPVCPFQRDTDRVDPTQSPTPAPSSLPDSTSGVSRRRWSLASTRRLSLEPVNFSHAPVGEGRDLIKAGRAPRRWSLFS